MNLADPQPPGLLQVSNVVSEPVCLGFLVTELQEDKQKFGQDVSQLDQEAGTFS